MKSDSVDEQTGTVPSMFWSIVRKRGDATMLRQKVLGVWRPYSWNDADKIVADVAAGLIELGLRPGDVVSVLSNTNKEWVFVDLGAQTAGGVVCGLYPTCSASNVKSLCAESRTRFLFVEDEEQLDKLFEVIDRLAELRHVFVLKMEGSREPADPRAISFVDMLRVGAAARSREPGIVERGLASRCAQDIAILAYTSGATGKPKGVLLTHSNVLAACNAMRAGVFAEAAEGGERVLFASLCQIAERINSEYLSMQFGAVMNFVENSETAFENLREVQPNILLAAPHIWGKLHSDVSIALKEATPFERWAYARAMDVGRKVSSIEEQWRRPGLGLRFRFWLARKFVLNNVRRFMGLDRLRMGLSGAAPMSRALIRWYRSIGVDLREVWGMTELAGGAIVTPGRPRPGSVGKPLPSIEIALSDAGEIWVRGPNVFAGYLSHSEETAALSADGWLRTGDLGRVDEDGYFHLTGRIEDVIVTASGERVTPSEWENELKFSPYIADALVVGEQRPHLASLILIDHDNVERWALEHDIAFSDFQSLSRDSDVLALIGREIDTVNRTFATEKQIRSFRLIEAKLGPEDEEFAPTMKLKRRFVCEKYAEVIDSMYAVRAA